jgi:hypothetical protein
MGGEREGSSMLKVDKFPRRHILVYLFTLPGDLICWTFVLLIGGFFGDRFVWQNGLWFEIAKDSWFYKTFLKDITGGTMGHGGWYRSDLIGEDGIDTKLEFHEHVHVEQYEAVMTAIFVVVLGFFLNGTIRGDISSVWLMSLVYWAIGGLIGAASGWLVAVLRGERAYSGSSHEEAAYALERGFKSEKKTEGVH